MDAKFANIYMRMLSNLRLGDLMRMGLMGVYLTSAKREWRSQENDTQE